MEHKEEIWVSVPSYSEYFVSNFGRVKRNNKIIRQKISGNREYLMVGLCKDGIQRTVTVHSLVALCFIGDRIGNMVINHIDMDKRNNKADNLEYTTQLENLRHARKHGLFSNPPIMRGEENNKSKLTYLEVRTIRNKASFLMKEMSRQYGVNKESIRNILGRKTWNHIK
jgi:hypothetical protein